MLCIDVCDDVMVKIGKLCGLIDYVLLVDVENECVGKVLKLIWCYILWLCMVIYIVIWVVFGVVLVYVLFIWFLIDVIVVLVWNLIYVLLFDGGIWNIYDLCIWNMYFDDIEFVFSVMGVEGLILMVEGCDVDVVIVGVD